MQAAHYWLHWREWGTGEVSVDRLGQHVGAGESREDGDPDQNDPSDDGSSGHVVVV